MAKGRQPGAKNKPGHSGGGWRRGSGRKKKEPVSQHETNTPSTSTSVSGKRKKPDSKREKDNRHPKKARKSDDSAMASGSGIPESNPTIPTAEAARPVEKPTAIYPIFRKRAEVEEMPLLGAGAPRSVLNVAPPIVNNLDLGNAHTTESVASATYESNIPPELSSVAFDVGNTDCSAEEAPSPEGVVQAYLDRIQKEVHETTGSLS
ncbi:hypothetical protein R3P38DRAFT_2762431 [Favolaschia claudopus]|uniref:Uncharacterized protein n=1 Tax=Favolaschia claudopus TaxID=2862362 RepID=A0AAW0DLW8_9AGAR